MHNDKYYNINKALEKVFELDKISPFFINNYYNIYKLSENISFIIMNNQNVYYKKTKDNELENLKIIKYSYDFLSKFNSDYSNELYKMFLDGNIIFSDLDISSSCNYDELNNKILIFINKTNNYLDVTQLIHEFMHSTNLNDKSSFLRKDLSEYISIYFEFLSELYLLNDLNINIKNIDTSYRFKETFSCSNDILRFKDIFLSYQFSPIDENSPKLLKDNYDIDVSSERLEFSCNCLLKKFKLLNNSYDNIAKYIEKTFSYVLGTSLALYSIDNMDVKDVLFINNNLKRDDIDTESLLKSKNIIINEDYIEKNNKSMLSFIKKLKI